MPKDREGFVVRFSGGLRVKIKGAEYMRIHKMISNMSPISFWESMENGVVNKNYLAELPEEFRKDFEPIVEELESQYRAILDDIKLDIKLLPVSSFITKEDLKAVGLVVQSRNHGLKHPGSIFSYVLNKPEALNKYIMKYIRPTSNNLRII